MNTIKKTIRNTCGNLPLACLFMGFSLLVLGSCKKNEDDIKVESSFWCDYSLAHDREECRTQEELSLEELSEYVIGNWDLRAAACGYCAKPKPGCDTFPSGEIRVSFLPDGTLLSQYSDGSVMTGRYEVRAEPLWGNRVVLTDDDPNGGFFYAPAFSMICGRDITYIDSRPSDGGMFIYERN